MSTFGGIEMGKQAINAFRLGMQTVGHNISNMGTEGYSRQRAIYKAVEPMNIPNIGQVGQGMEISEITRIRDEFLDFQFRNVQADLGYYEKLSEMYDNIQNYIAEPNASGIRDAMNNFFEDMQTLQQQPEDIATRRSLVTSANTLGMLLGDVITNLEKYNSSVNTEIQEAVEEANDMLYEIAALNKEIYHAEALNQNANDLRDQRDVIIDKLSKMLDIEYNEPMTNGKVTGEFFLTLNGRTLVQGQAVRELKAHAFIWNNQTYYDVQVAQNEFNIVDNTNVCDALATGAEGSYMLSVDRIANNKEWSLGGGDAYCLETRQIVTAGFTDGIILDASSEDIPYKLEFRTLDGDTPVKLVMKIDRDSTGWNLRAEIDDVAIDMTDTTLKNYNHSQDATLTVQDLKNLLSAVVNYDKSSTKTGATGGRLESSGLNIVIGDDNSMTISTEDVALDFHDYSGMLGALSEYKSQNENVNMRTRPMSVDEALNITGSFRIQVGTQGTRVASKIFKASAGSEFGDGEILRAWSDADGEPSEHTFRIGVADSQIDISASWNKTSGQWILSSDFGTSQAAGEILTVEELSDFMSDIIDGINNDELATESTALRKLEIGSGPQDGTKTQFYIASNDGHLISISDVKGNLASRMGIVNENPVITIDVNENDSLGIIRNKINEKYQEVYGLTEPEQWVHAEVIQDDDNSFYLTISADVAGEAQRITLMGSEDGNMQVLRRLGLTYNENAAPEGYTENYREIAYIGSASQDASFLLNGIRYLSSDNMFNQARRVPSASSKNDYTASKLVSIGDGLWLNLKGTGDAAVTVKHHVRNGEIKSLEEVRDGAVPELLAALDEMAYELVKDLNAYQYSGYGIGDDITSTGTAFFNALMTKNNAAKSLSVTQAVQEDYSLIGAASGLVDENGYPVSGVSSGSGDGSNAYRIVVLSTEKVIDGTMTIGGVYDAMLSQIGSEAAQANVLYNTQATVSSQIDAQRQAVSGVNLDEELVDIVVLNRAFGAMARYVSAMDEMLNTLINGFGLVGR